MEGGALSRTVTMKEQRDSFPALSLAVQVTVVGPEGKTWPEGGLQATTGCGSQRSVAVTVKFTIVPPGPAHSTSMSPGHWIRGGVVSTTVTLKLHMIMLPLWSSAVQTTMVWPMGNTDPEAGRQTRFGAGSQVSVAVGGGYSTLAPSGPVHSRTMSSGQTSVGGAVSTTRTSKLQLAMFPELSVAVHLMVWLPRERKVFCGGTQTTSGEGSQRSLTTGGGYWTVPPPC
jgi:hypothetical protein